MATPQRRAYQGTQRKLVIAIDVGTTFSGVSYALLDPGKVPQIQPVTQFIGQNEPKGDSKVPSIVCYDQSGTPVAAGAETDSEVNPTLAEMEGAVRVEWFKLHLRPPQLAPDQKFELQKLRSFPKNKTPIQVLRDFLSYLFQSTKRYIVDSEIWSWNSIESNIYFVLSHPNGWEGKQQSQIRRAAISAGLVAESEGLEKLSFVTEGEASLHFCLNKIPNLHGDHTHDGIMVVDCGGGTIDVSTYSRKLSGGFKEATSPKCVFQGSIFVTCRAEKYFRKKLRNSTYGSDEEVEAMASAFDKVTKCTFNGPETPYYVKFGGPRDNDAQYDIRSGSIKIPGAHIVDFFEPAIQGIISVINRQCAKSNVKIKSVFLVGGFARSNYLFSRLNNYFNSRAISVRRADTTHLWVDFAGCTNFPVYKITRNKAVADGAVSYYLDHYVSKRITRHSYGVETIDKFDASNPEHIRRIDTKYMEDADGEYYIPGVFSTILRKRTAVSEETEFRHPYFRLMARDGFKSLAIHLQSYQGQTAEPPRWIDLEPDSFSNICSVHADITNARKKLKAKYNNKDKRYYQFNYEVVLLFGHTELKAYVAWKENGVERRSPAYVVYE